MDILMIKVFIVIVISAALFPIIGWAMFYVEDLIEDKYGYAARKTFNDWVFGVSVGFLIILMLFALSHYPRP